MIPYERHFKEMSILDILDTTVDKLIVNTALKDTSKDLINEYKRVKENNLLLKIEFNTIYEYLTMFKFISSQLSVVNERALVYLAAAVSDFYIPNENLPKHKIQSNGNDLHIALKPVPKLLGMLKKSWCKLAFVVSFKLETDENLLEIKCKKSLEIYKHDVVIGNLLNERKYHVSVFGNDFSKNKMEMINDIFIKDFDIEIEKPLIFYIISLHDEYISKIY
jgi:phosphopantothenate-cysteine ligase